jgi:hypothetical protein
MTNSEACQWHFQVTFHPCHSYIHTRVLKWITGHHQGQSLGTVYTENNDMIFKWTLTFAHCTLKQNMSLNEQWNDQGWSAHPQLVLPSLHSRVIHTVLGWHTHSICLYSQKWSTSDHLCGLVVRVPGCRTEMYCASCEVQTEFIYLYYRGLHPVARNIKL